MPEDAPLVPGPLEGEAYEQRFMAVKAWPTPGTGVHLTIIKEGAIALAVNLDVPACAMLASACSKALIGSDWPQLYVAVSNPLHVQEPLDLE